MSQAGFEGPVVVVGAGLAGVKAVEGLRQAGFAGRIVLIGEETHAPYDRPPLSKDVLTSPGHEARIGLHRDGELEALGAELKLGRRATAVDAAAQVVILDDGERIAYGRLILATGSRLRILPALPPSDRVHYLRSLDDALRLRSALADARKVAVIGAGVIGLEVAAAAAKAGAEVVVIETGDRVMARAAAPAVSAFLTERHIAHGVAFRLGEAVSEVESKADGVVLSLSHGERIAADLVVVGVGVRPDVTLAESAGLELRAGGVMTDAFGRTSDPAIYAAGEVACGFNAFSDTHERQETWAHAAAHGEHVGRALMGEIDGYDELGSYWTDQYDVTLQVLGESQGDVDVVRGDPASDSFIVYHLKDGAVAGASAINAARELRVGKILIRNRARIAPEQLADPAFDLRKAAT